MQVKTSELTGAALDWAVAKCEWFVHKGNWQGTYNSPYSTEWAQGGPIIEREGITVSRDGDTCDAYIREFLFDDDGKDCYHTGPTMLVAAMRCYVASKLGNTVEIPDSLN